MCFLCLGIEPRIMTFGISGKLYVFQSLSACVANRIHHFNVPVSAILDVFIIKFILAADLPRYIKIGHFLPIGKYFAGIPVMESKKRGIFFVDDEKRSSLIIKRVLAITVS